MDSDQMTNKYPEWMTPTRVLGRGFWLGIWVTLNLIGFALDSMGMEGYLEWARERWVHMSPVWHFLGVALGFLAYFYSKGVCIKVESEDVIGVPH